jgi:hypothetical protein
MGINMRGLTSTVLGIAFIVIVIGSYVIIAQEAVSGTWKASTDVGEHGKQGEIHLSFERRSERGGRNQNGNSYAYSDLDGLSPNANGPVNFRLVREAGTIVCEGTFANGKGSGSFTFQPNQTFLSGMQSRGYTLSPERQFISATLNLTLAYTDELRSLNLGEIDIDDVFKGRIFDVTAQFVSDMRSTGFPNLDLEDLVKARIFKISPDYVREVSAMGFDNRDFEALVKFRIFKVTPEFLNSIRAEGFTNLSAEQVVKFRIFKIDADFIRNAKASDPNVSVEDLVRMKIGVHRRGHDDDSDD